MMKTLVTLFGAGLLICIGLAAFAASVVSTPHFSPLNASRSIYLGVTFFFFFCGYSVFFSAFRFTRENRGIIALLTCIFIYGAYAKAMRDSTDLPLSMFFKTGTDCASVLNIVPIESARHIGRTSEATCYLSTLRNQLKPLELSDQTSQLSQAAHLFSKQGRMDETALTLFTSITVVNHVANKRTLTSPVELQLNSLDMAASIAELAELMPPNINEQGSRRVVASLLNKSKKIITEAQEKFPVREPASIEPLSIQAKTIDLINRWQAIGERWQFSEGELARAASKN